MAMTEKDGKLPSKASSTDDIDAFLRQVATMAKAPGQRGRLIFAMDATASRQPSWDQASNIQAKMFTATQGLGGLEVQLAWYRGFGGFFASPWLTDSSGLLRLMTSVFCLAGETQLRKVLKHAIKETRSKRVNALVFVGDSFEEDVDKVGALAGEMGLLGLPAFMFHEGSNPVSTYAFKQVAKLSNGAFCRFDPSSPKVLSQLLGAVAVFAAGGHAALEDLGRRDGGDVLAIAHQMKGA